MSVLRFISKIRFLSPKRKIELYPPFWIMRVKVLSLAEDYSQAKIRLPLNYLSKNMGDSMFGGYQASLADPIAALACAKRFPGYSIWTRAMTIDFLREGNTNLELRFEFPEQLHKDIDQELKEKGRSTPTFEYGFYREDGELCSKISNTVAIRPKDYASGK